MDKWLDKLENGGQFEGLTNEGFNNNGAWGGSAQSGTKFPNILSELKKKTPEKFLEEKYYNPEKREDITSGDLPLDLLYKNDWLLDTPIVGDYIKGKAKDI